MKQGSVNKSIELEKNYFLADKEISPIILILFYLTLLIAWLVVLFYSFPLFQNSRNIEPFAEINSLFPFFFIVLGTYAISTFMIFWKYHINKWTMVLILMIGGLMLWYTPYLLSGFVKQNDTIWHMGMAANINYILDGALMPFSSYSASYPFSFFFGYAANEILGVSLLTISNLIMPLIFTLSFILLFYIIFLKFFNEKISGISALASIALLHYVELHFSPHVIGSIILLTIIILLLNEKLLLSLFLALVILPLTHTISFGFALVIVVLYVYLKRENYLKFLFAREEKKLIKNNKNIKIAIILFSCVLIFGIFFTNIPKNLSSLYSRFPISSLIPFITDNMIQAPWFKMVSVTIYIVAFALFLYIILKKSLKLWKVNKNIKALISTISNRTVFLVLFPLICMGLSVMLAATEKSSVLIERGLTFFLLFTSLFLIGQTLNNLKNKRAAEKTKKYLAFIVLGLFMVYPISSYSIDTYNSYTASERDGIQYLTTQINVSNSYIDMPALGQTYLFISPSSNISGKLPNGEVFDFIIYRISSDYKTMLHTSEDNNPYTQKFDSLNNNREYQKIYHNPTFYIYELNEGN